VGGHEVDLILGLANEHKLCRDRSTSEGFHLTKKEKDESDWGGETTPTKTERNNTGNQEHKNNEQRPNGGTCHVQ